MQLAAKRYERRTVMSFKLKKIPYYISHIGIYKKYFSDKKNFENYVKKEKEMGLPCALISGTTEYYLFGIKDISIPFDMFINKCTFPEEEIKLFFKLTEKYYNRKPQSKDYFFDIGANIGTTSIYVKRNIFNEMNVVAFEPEPFNYKLLRANALLNDCEDIRCENIGLSSKEGTATMAIFPENRGRNQIVSSSDMDLRDKEKIDISIMSLDDYIGREHIDSNFIKWLWIDTEGHEVEVLKGMKDLLSEYHIPIFMEFNPDCYDSESTMNMQEIFGKQYKNVIAINTLNGEKKQFSVEKIREFAKSTKEQYNIFLY